jgi:hypothetical protein
LRRILLWIPVGWDPNLFCRPDQDPKLTESRICIRNKYVISCPLRTALPSCIYAPLISIVSLLPRLFVNIFLSGSLAIFLALSLAQPAGFFSLFFSLADPAIHNYLYIKKISPFLPILKQNISYRYLVNIWITST